MKLGEVFESMKTAFKLTKPGFDVESTGKSLFKPKITSDDRLEMTIQEAIDQKRLIFNKDGKARLFVVDSSMTRKLYVDLLLKN